MLKKFIITEDDLKKIDELKNRASIKRRIEGYIKVLTDIKTDLYMISDWVKSDEINRIGAEISGIRLDLMDEKNRLKHEALSEVGNK